MTIIAEINNISNKDIVIYYFDLASSGHLQEAKDEQLYFSDGRPFLKFSKDLFQFSTNKDFYKFERYIFALIDVCKDKLNEPCVKGENLDVDDLIKPDKECFSINSMRKGREIFQNALLKHDQEFVSRLAGMCVAKDQKFFGWFVGDI